MRIGPQGHRRDAQACGPPAPAFTVHRMIGTLKPSRTSSPPEGDVMKAGLDAFFNAEKARYGPACGPPAPGFSV